MNLYVEWRVYGAMVKKNQTRQMYQKRAERILNGVCCCYYYWRWWWWWRRRLRRKQQRQHLLHISKMNEAKRWKVLFFSAAAQRTCVCKYACIRVNGFLILVVCADVLSVIRLGVRKYENAATILTDQHMHSLLYAFAF